MLKCSGLQIFQFLLPERCHSVRRHPPVAPKVGDFWEPHWDFTSSGRVNRPCGKVLPRAKRLERRLAQCGLERLRGLPVPAATALRLHRTASASRPKSRGLLGTPLGFHILGSSESTLRQGFAGGKTLGAATGSVRTGKAYRSSSSCCHSVATASDGIRQSPRGLRVAEPTLGPSGTQERLNCWLKKRR